MMSKLDEILISVKEQYATNIFSGEKTVELRKRRPNIVSGTRIWIYVTAPTAEIWGYANLVDIKSAPPTVIWDELGSQTGLSKREFDDYFEFCQLAHALLLSDVMIMARALSLAKIRERVIGFHPPQFFCHLNGDKEAMGLSLRKYESVRA